MISAYCALRPDKDSPLGRSPAPFRAAAWAALRNQDAPLRIVRDGRLVSAPLTHFDAVLISQATRDWEVAAKVIGRTLQH
ncbi:DUF3658 domain-containing protein [Methylobacterium sp. E-005]|uniref:DUF3658 domain-containing protein n=1 Tax=Methylobacterium sp. E-005 TaxID=2836549 RepID=UPI00391D910B